MVRKHHKVLSLVLCLILAVSAICAGTVGATAATGDTIYFKPGHWTEASAWFSVYAWDGNGGTTFVKMTEVESGVYGADLGGSYSNVIFCRNDPAKTAVDWSSAWNQTADLTVQSGTNCFTVNSGEWSNATGTWSTYSGGDVIVTDPVTTDPVSTDSVTTDPVTSTPSAGGTTVYLQNDANWSTPYCYMWNSSSDANNTWPGLAMTSLGNGVYKITASSTYANCIFSNNGSSQTADLTAKSGYIYNNSTGVWTLYNEDDVITTNPVDDPTTPTTTTPVVGGTYTVYCKNTAGWSTVNCYMWNSGTDSNATWPGASMTNIGGDVWMYTASKEYANCIFNNGSTQSDDLVAKYGYIYDNSTKTWEVYDTSPIQVTSYSADPTSDVYIDSAVTLSATATSTTGATVYYQFSVTNASGGTSVVSNYSTANTATWTPSAAGTYTITFDFKDSEGNENSRTLSITVGDDSTLVKPVIKSVIPTNLGFIKVGSATTVTVKAGGGITGTNLLFYKYVVTDPNGVENTPYYTLNNTYSLTPTMAGTYTVVVYVQGSDNSTVSKTYKYTATTSDITVPTTDVPVETEPTTTNPIETEPTTTDPIVTDPDVIKGDVDGDGRVSVKDATYIQKHVVDYEGYEIVDLAIGDMDGDGRISVKDATAIQKIII